MAVLGSFTLRVSLAMALALLVALAAGGSEPAQAANIVVNTTDDELNSDSDCSLREAITAANTDATVDACTAGSGADTVTLPAGTYTLSIAPDGTPDDGQDGDLDITDDLTITGAGVGSTIVDGDGIDRVFEVLLAASVEMTDLTVYNGAVSGSADGGGIRNVGSLSLNNVAVTNNRAFNGAGIANGSGGSLIVNNSTVSGNETTGNSGGGIINRPAATVVLNNSTVSGNSAAGDQCVGGGIAVAGGTVTIESSTVSGNSATGEGGGIWNGPPAGGSAGSATLTNVTVSANTATAGGGIAVIGGMVTLENTTVSGNTATGDGGGIWNGPPPWGPAGSVMLTNVTVSANTATAGGGIHDTGTSGPSTMSNTIVANSVSGSDCSGTITSNGNNLDSDGTCGLGAGEFPNTDPSLGPLADNGGPTQTHALLSGSPAIDTGDDAACPATDQRGVARPIDGDGNGTAVCDIGAYEYEPPPATPTPTPTPAPSPSPTPAELPPTGGNPGFDGDAPTVAILLLMAGALGLAGVGSALMGRWQRR